jgi:hypothetical protein
MSCPVCDPAFRVSKQLSDGPLGTQGQCLRLLWHAPRISDTRSLRGMVATDWTAISLAALGVGGTIVGGFLGAWMQRHGQELQELQRQRDFAAEVIATARQLLTDFAPDHLVRTDIDVLALELTP